MNTELYPTLDVDETAEYLLIFGKKRNIKLRTLIFIICIFMFGL
jgi:hypothetical protein